MIKTTSITALVAGISLTVASAAHAQASAADEQRIFASFNLGGQVQTRTLTSGSTFTAFNETGTINTNQTVGRAFVVDLGAGYRLTDHIGIAVGVWTAQGKGSSASTIAIPDPVFFNHFTTVNTSASDLKHTDVGVNLQFVWTTALTDQIDFSFFIGPTIIHVSQDIASATVDPGTQTATGAIVKESKTTGKAGNVGFDLSYAVTDRYGAGVFVRYAGGEADLPSAPHLKLGGIQLGGGIRMRF